MTQPEISPVSQKIKFHLKEESIFDIHYLYKEINESSLIFKYKICESAQIIYKK